MIMKRTHNSENTINDVKGDVNIGDTYNRYEALDETGFRKKVIACLRNKETVETCIEELATFMNKKTEETTIGLEKKLTEAGYSDFLQRAMETKEHFVKLLSKNLFSISFQKIIYAAIDEAISTFTYSIRPLIDADQPPSQVMAVISDLIFERLYKDIADITEFDFGKCSIEGLVFFLTGNCFLRWAKDANIQQN